MTALSATLQARGDRYGGFPTLARLSQRLKAEASQADGWDDLPDHAKEALEMIFLKAARIICGNHAHIDNWHDIAGYARLVEIELEGGEMGNGK